MGTLKPYIISEDARAQSEFYLQALGGEIMSVSTHGELPGAPNELKDKVMHMCLAIAGENFLFMADAIEPVTHGTDLALTIAYPTEAEAAEAFAKLAVGGTVKHPIEMQPFGIYYGELTDKFGVIWMITAEPKAE
ncbi:VOC family protein [Paenibacillus flagellatus]|uniref:PhnB-like domain-containing protein n=1 Tax=Paenibacillus flagellatus TaxID=2211139 RepID=A0A2V5JV66_9BACL|nr:VOC family protein [Paenibacillus flagellatus]PYI50569.1 hypothetical protein DLM86_29145 [Paenibacillus flagellatus]